MATLRTTARRARSRRRFRELCLSFPGVTEAITGPKAVYRVGKEPFACFEDVGAETRASVRLGPEDYRERSPESVELLRKHVVRENYVTIPLDAQTEWDEVRDLLLMAYVAVAPKRRLQELEGALTA